MVRSIDHADGGKITRSSRVAAVVPVPIFMKCSCIKNPISEVSDALRSANLEARSAVRSGIRPSFEKLPAEQIALAKRIVKELEDREGRPVTDISEARIDEYSKLVSERLQTLARRQFPVASEVNGEALLGKLRLVR